MESTRSDREDFHDYDGEVVPFNCTSVGQHGGVRQRTDSLATSGDHATRSPHTALV